MLSTNMETEAQRGQGSCQSHTAGRWDSCYPQAQSFSVLQDGMGEWWGTHRLAEGVPLQSQHALHLVCATTREGQRGVCCALAGCPCCSRMEHALLRDIPGVPRPGSLPPQNFPPAQLTHSCPG
jgi:hypothetical protein